MVSESNDLFSRVGEYFYENLIFESRLSFLLTSLTSGRPTRGGSLQLWYQSSGLRSMRPIVGLYAQCVFLLKKLLVFEIFVWRLDSYFCQWVVDVRMPPRRTVRWEICLYVVLQYEIFMCWLALLMN